MIWSTQLHCAAGALFAIAVSYAVSAWAIPSARAFTMENLSTGGNTTRFAEPDGPANNFGRGAQPFGPGGPMVQFGARHGQLTPFSRSPGSGYNSTPPEPYARHWWLPLPPLLLIRKYETGRGLPCLLQSRAPPPKKSRRLTSA